MELHLRYSQPTRTFMEALMLGNGTHGAMVYGLSLSADTSVTVRCDD